MNGLRPQCAACPWRNPDDCEATVPGVVEHARNHPDGFVCHTRLGPCDGPRWAGLAPAREGSA